MRRVLFIFILLIGSLPYALASEPTFKLTSDCVSSVEVGQASYAPLNQVTIILNEDSAEKLLNFSNKHLNKKVTVIDGFGNILSEARIMSPISSKFVIVGLDSENEAKQIKEKLMKSKGVCGDVAL